MWEGGGLSKKATSTLDLQCVNRNARIKASITVIIVYSLGSGESFDLWLLCRKRVRTEVHRQNARKDPGDLELQWILGT